MSSKRDWKRARTRDAAIAPPADLPYDGPVRVDPLEPLIRAALAAKRAGEYFPIPKTLTAAEIRRLWRAVSIRLGHDRITGGPTPA